MSERIDETVADLGSAESIAFETGDATIDEGKAAMSAFLDGFEGFKSEMSAQLGTISARVDALDAKAVAGSRPALSRAADTALPAQKAFSAFVRAGDEEGMRSLALEQKGLNTGSNPQGGFLVDPQVAAQIERRLRGGGSLRTVARGVQVEAGSYDVLIDNADLLANWADETTVATETTPPTVERISILLHELSANPQASHRLLDDSAFDVEAWLADRIADRFRRAEAAAFVSGDGVGKPVGFLTKPQLPDAAHAWGTLGYLTTGVPGGFDLNDPGDVLVDLVYALGAEYRDGASFVMSSRTAGEVRKMKDNQGRFLWVEGISDEAPARLLGYPVVVVEDMPDIGTDSVSIAFGNFEHGYTIAERPEIRMLRDPFSAKPNVMFYATKRVGGDVTDYGAIKLLKFSA
ncbi:MAG: phage major capsid protein [Pseudomonadota bacterium]